MSARKLLRQLVAEAFPWLERIGLTPKGDLSIKSASTKIEIDGSKIALAGGTKPVHRVDDLGHAGTFSLGAPGNLLLTRPDGSSFLLTFTSASPGAPVVIALVDFSPTPGKLVTKAETGSEKVSSG